MIDVYGIKVGMKFKDIDNDGDEFILEVKGIEIRCDDNGEEDITIWVNDGCDNVEDGYGISDFKGMILIS